MKKKTEPIVNSFWPNPESLSRINIVNPQDFTPPEIISSLKNSSLLPDSFGLTNLREIRLRNEISRFLLEHPETWEKINAWLKEAGNFSSLPNSENDFLRVYGQTGNPYWEMIGQVITEFDRPDAPARLKGFAERLKSEKANLAELEKAMALRISEKLEKVTAMEGVFDLNPFADRSEGERFILGRKSYSAKWSSGYKVDAPKWTENLLCRITGIKKLATSLKASVTKINAYRSAAVLHFPSCLYNDIHKGIKELMQPPLRREDPDVAISENEKKKHQKLIAEINHLKDTLRNDNFVMTVYFRYNSNGLSIRVIGLRKRVEKYEFELQFRDFEGYTEKERKAARLIESQMAGKMKHTQEMTGVLASYEQLQKHFKLFDRYIKIPAVETDSEFKWYAIHNLYHLKENAASYTQLVKQRLAFKRSLEDLSRLSRTIQMFVTKAEQLDIPVCIPEIRDSGKIGVSFNGLAPINMMGQNKKMVPFDLPTINGQMICLTGRHGGGKSVTGKSVIENIYLAQSGLPVFAETFSLDVKTVLGAVTNDEGEGSTATVFVNKVKNLLEEIHKVPKEQSLVFIDEIGKGTQEEAGFRLGKMILSVLQGKQFSVIFNTQIMGLAEYAQNNLGALCLKVDKNHRFSEGIGDGQMDELIKESGLDHFLSKN